MPERKIIEEENLVRCSKCKSYYKGIYSIDIKKTCIGNDAEVPRKTEISTREMQTRLEEEFETEILSRFQRHYWQPLPDG